MYLAPESLAKHRTLLSFGSKLMHSGNHSTCLRKDSALPARLVQHFVLRISRPSGRRQRQAMHVCMGARMPFTLTIWRWCRSSSAAVRRPTARARQLLACLRVTRCRRERCRSAVMRAACTHDAGQLAGCAELCVQMAGSGACSRTSVAARVTMAGHTAGVEDIAHQACDDEDSPSGQG